MGKFAVIPANIFDRGLDPAQIALLAAMSACLNKHGYVQSTYEQLGKMVGRSKAWTKENIDKLAKNGLIKRDGRAFSILYDVQYTELKVQPAEQATPLKDKTVVNINNNNIYNKKSSRKKPSLPLPDDFEITPKMAAWATNSRPDVDFMDQTNQFKSWALAKDIRYSNWEQAWYNWIRRSEGRKNVKAAKPDSRQIFDHFQAATERAKQV